MIDRDALHAALREFHTDKCNTDTSHVPSTCVRKAIEAYLAAAPLPDAANLAAALRGMLQAVCGETGFANAVRVHSETAYPWEALDIAEKAAHDALAVAPLPGAGEPVGYIDGPRFDGETGKIREGGAHLFSSGRGLLHPVPLYTAAPLPTLCEDCPPIGYPTDKTRCEPCPRSAAPLPPAEPVAWRVQREYPEWRLSDNRAEMKAYADLGYTICPLYTAAPDTAQAWECSARKQGTAGGNDPADCNWPLCNCDPYANKVTTAIEEAGFPLDCKCDTAQVVAAEREACAKIARDCSERWGNDACFGAHSAAADIIAGAIRARGAKP